MSMELERLVLTAVLSQLALHGVRQVPVAVSARHVHLCDEHAYRLLGHPPTKMRALIQPGQYACEETLMLQSPCGKTTRVRVLGPLRGETQVELSVSDCIKVGIKPYLRLSGDLAQTPGGLLIGPAGTVELSYGVIVSQRHLHLSLTQAKAYGLKDGDIVGVRISGQRPGLMENIVVRAGDAHELELHIDTDEANAYLLGGKDFAELIVQNAAASAGIVSNPLSPTRKYSLITEADVNESHSNGKTQMICEANGIVTPAARDRANEVGMEIVKDDCIHANL